MYGVEVAIVTNVQDPEKAGRVKICFPRLPGKPESDWARVSQPSAGPGRGFYWLPEVNDEVLVAFERGQANQPFVLGALWNGKDKPMKDAYTDENTTRMIQTKSGHQIVLSDKAGEEKMTFADGSGKRTLTFDVKEKKFLIEAKEGDVEIHAKKKLVLQCEDLEIKTSKTGKFEIGTTFDLKVADKASFKAGPKMELKAGKVNLNPPSLSIAALVTAAEAAVQAAAAAAATAAAQQQQAATGGAAPAAAGPATVPTSTPAAAGGAPSAAAGGAAGPAGAAPPRGTAPTTAPAGGSAAPNGAAGQPAAAANAAAAAAAARFEIEIEVLDARDKPMPNFAFELTLPGGEKQSGFTGPDGVVRSESATDGEAKLEVFPERPKPPEEPKGVLKVTVQDDKGPVAEVSVRASSSKGGVEVRSDPAGIALFGALPEGDYRISTRHDEFENGSGQATVSAATAGAVSIKLQRRRVRIRLLDFQGKPAARARFAITNSGPQDTSGTADDNGDLTLVDSGRDTITVSWSLETARAAKAAQDIEVIDRDGRVQRERIDAPQPSPHQFTREVQLRLPQLSGERGAGPLISAAAARNRLNNLGYVEGATLGDLIRAFQRDCGDPETGVLADAQAKLLDFHDVQVRAPGPAKTEED